MVPGARVTVLRPTLKCSDKSIAEQHPDWPALEIGGYSIGPCVHGGWWIENEDGEGMQVSSGALVDMFGAFWARNF